MFTVNQVLQKHYPQVAGKPYLQKPLNVVLKKLLHEDDVIAFERQYGHLSGIDFVEQVLDYFDISFSVRDVEKERIPASGPLVIIANHPIGSLDALSLIKLVHEVRSDLQVVANEMLMALTPLNSLLLPVNNMQGNTPKQNLQRIHHHVKNQGAVLIFPAGEVSRLRPQGVRDTKWHSGFLRIAKAAHAPILPVFIDAKNSATFYGVSMLFKPLATTLLIQEMFKHKRKHINLRVGELIPFDSFCNLGVSVKDQVKLFKRHLYRVGKSKAGLFITQSAIAHAEDRRELSKVIKRDCEKLGETGDGKRIYLYQHTGSSPIMREIGRLREIAFRAVGEGSNKRRDIDAFDSHYWHLILWDPDELEIAGAYRFGDAKALSQASHSTGLYSATLFDYQPNMQAIFNQGLELGRSFVQPKYWGKRSLDYLWFGIGAFVSKYPQYRYLFGPVSISGAFPKPAIELIAAFYHTYFPQQKILAKGKLPLHLSQTVLATFSGEDYKKELKELKSQLENMNVSIPTLLKQYAEVCEPGGVSIDCFNIDPDFNDCIDGLVVMDVQKLTKKKRMRYMPNLPIIQEAHQTQ